MDALAGYGSDGEDDPMEATLISKPTGVNSAPMALTVHHSSQPNRLAAIDTVNNMLIANSRADVVLAPVQGPSNPFKFNATVPGASRVGLGTVETADMEDWCFNDQYQTYQKSGYAIDVDSKAVVGDFNEFIRNKGNSASYTKKITGNGAEKRKREELPSESLGDGSAGPWADVEPPKDAYQMALEAFKAASVPETAAIEDVPLDQHSDQKQDVAVEAKQRANMYIIEPDEEAEFWERKNEHDQSFVLPPRPARGTVASETKSTFHGPPGSERDYQGRPWCAAPSGMRKVDVPCEERHESFIPKKCIKKYTGHTKGVQQILFLPGTGHLLLSASLDGKCKIWDVENERNVKRTYLGHSEAVRSIAFNNTGTEFVSSGFDRYMNVWDVETGKTVGTFGNRKMGYDVKFSPADNNVFLMAASDNKIYQWDKRTGGVVQEYNYHLQPCNTITFFDDGRKFVTTSDDKKVLVWECDIPVPIKYIQEADMHSIPSVTLHPSEQFFVGQSMDNSIVTYTCGDKVRQLQKKTYRGHNNAGYACKIDFSPNGKFMMSGDGSGKLWFWDWKSMKIFRSFPAHENGPCMGSAWHPLHASMVATCGWDGLIKLWD